MENQLTEAQLRDIAKQLAHPQGEDGLKIAARMAENNKGMVMSAIDALNLANNDVVLEIGPADAPHLGYLLNKAPHLQYFGADISADMIALAKASYANETSRGAAHFYLVDGEELPFPTLRFDKIFTANTIYFWKNPLVYAKEIKRVLKPGGLFSIAFADKDFMETLLFTRYGFTLFSKADVVLLLQNAGFTVMEKKEINEKVTTLKNEVVHRSYWVVSAQVR